MADTQVSITLEADKEDALLDDVEEENTAPKNRGPRLKSTVGRASDEASRRTKGRGFQPAQKDVDMAEDRYSGAGGRFEVLDDEGKSGPLRSVEGWIIFITGVHEEASEDDILDKFNEFGEVKSLQLPLDRRTGFVKGYALVEYETKEEADAAIKEMNGGMFMEKTLTVDWAFNRAPGGGAAGGARNRDNNNRPRGGRGPKRYTRQ
jgi:RNA-binding protein 8A